MKNLSLQMTQIAPLKKAEPTSKINLNADKSSTVESNNSFQAMLNKQVNSQNDSNRQESTQQDSIQKASNLLGNAEAKVADDKKELKVSHKGFAPKVTVDSQSKGNRINTENSHDKSEIESTDLADSADLISKAQTLQASKTSPDQVSAVETKPEDIGINAPDNAAIAAAASLLAQVVSSPVLNTIAIVKPQETTAVTTDETAISEGQSQKQNNLDAMLGSALLQAKNKQGDDIKGSDIQAKNNKTQASYIQDAQTTISDNAMPDNANRLDVVPQNTNKNKGDIESLNAKIMLNSAKEGVNKEAATKDMVIPTSHQSVVPTNTAAPTQHTAASSNLINIYPGKSGWDQAISQKVVWMVGASEQSATLTLNPPDLGPLQVVINVTNDMVDTTFISDNAEVRQALQDGMSNLREKMNESGIQLGQSNVSSGGQLQQQFQQTSQQQNSRSKLDNTTLLPIEKVNTAQNSIRIANGLVDTFA